MSKRQNPTAKISLPSDLEIEIVRDFAAPKSLVFEMWATPEHVRQWYGCEAMTVPVCEVDFRVGGSWRWVLHDLASGADHALSGKYTEIARPDRIVFTERYEPIPGSDHVVTLELDDREGITTLRQRYVHTSKDNRDGHLRAGMDRGLEAQFARMDEVVASISKTVAAPRGEGRTAGALP